jgi:hypothetical protein
MITNDLEQYAQSSVTSTLLNLGMVFPDCGRETADLDSPDETGKEPERRAGTKKERCG